MRNNMTLLSLLLLVLLLMACFLPEQASRWSDSLLLDTPVVLQDGIDREEFAGSVRLTIPEKLLLLRSGQLSSIPIPEEGTEVRIAITNGEAVYYESKEPELSLDAADADEAGELWRQRLSSVQAEVQALQRLGALPQLWDEDSAAVLTSRSELLYIDNDTQVSFAVYHMELSAAPYTLSLSVDNQTGRILSFSLRWNREAGLSWGPIGTASFGTAWRDYWGMDSVDTLWNTGYIQGILGDTSMQNQLGGDASTSGEVTFSYDGQNLRIPLYCWTAGSRNCSLQWNVLA